MKNNKLKVISALIGILTLSTLQFMLSDTESTRGIMLKTIVFISVFGLATIFIKDYIDYLNHVNKIEKQEKELIFKHFEGSAIRSVNQGFHEGNIDKVVVFADGKRAFVKFKYNENDEPYEVEILK